MTDLLFPDPEPQQPRQVLADRPAPRETAALQLESEAVPPVPVTPSPAAYRVLARAYRPQTFEDLIGQEAMVRTLTNAFSRNRRAHAYMLTGVRGVGKTTTARILARGINCVGPDGTGGPTIRPCGVCDPCRSIAEDRHPDVIELDAASHTGVDNARELMEQARLRPMSARARVFIIDEVHMLSNAAFNALLKTLEEPPPHVTFILATTELRRVPVTVLSRCQTFQLRRVPVVRLVEHFGGIAQREGAQIEPEALLLIARAADGSVRDGLSLLDQAIAMGDGQVLALEVQRMLGQADRTLVHELFGELMRGRIDAALAVFERLHEVGAAPATVIEDLLAHAHFLSRLKVAPALAKDPALPEADRRDGAALAETLSVPTLARAWQMLLKGLAEVQGAPDPHAAAEMVLIRVAFASDLPPPSDLVRQLQGRGDQGARGPSGAPSAQTGSPPWMNRASSVAGGLPQPTGQVEAVRAERVEAASAPVEEAQSSPRLESLRDVVALAQERREALLAGHLSHSVRLVRLAAPVIELRPEPDAPRDLAPRLAKFLLEATGTRWTVALSTATGDATLAEADRAEEAATLTRVARHPLVRAVLDAFPGATIEAVRRIGAGDAAAPGTRSSLASPGAGSEQLAELPDPDAVEPVEQDLQDEDLKDEDP